jgi:hypothetical protein
MGPPTKGEDVRPKLALLGLAVLASLVFLYLANLFYIQFLILVLGAAVILGQFIYERKAARQSEPGDGPAGAERATILREDLESVEQRLSGRVDESERRRLRLQEARLEQELRKIRWAAKEQDLEAVNHAAGAVPLRPLPPRPGFWERRRQDRLELGHLLRTLEEAEGVLAAEPPEAARTRIALVAADLKAHYGVLRDSSRRKRLGDYGAAWAVLIAISRGETLEAGLFMHATRKAKPRLLALVDLAKSRGIAGVSLRSPAREF